MKGVLFFLPVFLTISLTAQPGLYVAYLNLETPYWNLLDTGGPRFFQHGFGVGAGYRIPFSNGGLAFLPEAGYESFRQATSDVGHNQAQQIHLRAGLQVFPMQFLLNCDCPGLKNGLFAEGFAGWSRWDLAHNEADVQVADVAGAPFFGLNAGIRLPYGKSIVIAPVFRYTFFPSVTWEGLNTLRNPDTDPFFREESFLRQMSFEVHLSLSREQGNN